MAGKDDYVFAVTRVHASERGLLSVQDMQQLIAAKSIAEVFRYLSDKGWGTPDLPPNDPDALVAFETDRTWALVSELMDDLSPFNVFLMSNDYHNLKAAIKLAYTGDTDEDESSKYFQKYGTIPLETIIKAASDHDFTQLPADMAQAGREAYEVLAHTASGQQCDMVIDKAALISMDKSGKVSESELLRRYVVLTVDSANIKSAVRCARMQKNIDFCMKAIVDAGTLNAQELAKAAADGFESVCAYLSATEYRNSVDMIKTSMAMFERWCDNQMIELIKPQRNNYFSIEPIAAFILGRENEIKMVRLIASAKVNNLDSAVLQERLRETYV